jgi:hypothetical protein
MKKRNTRIVLSLLLLVMTGCAGAGGGSARVDKTQAVSLSSRPSKAIVKLSTTGSLPAGKKIGGLSAKLSYASGKGLSIAPDNVAVSGAGVGSTMVPNTNRVGEVLLGIITVNGMSPGEFATLSFDVSGGQVPTAADFSVAQGVDVIDTSAQLQSGIGVTIASVTLQ